MSNKLKVVLIVFVLFICSESISSRGEESHGISVFSVFSHDGMRRFFNTKFQYEQRFRSKFALRIDLTFLRVNTRYSDDKFFQELGLWGFGIGIKYKAFENLNVTMGANIFFTNFCHYDLDQTYQEWIPGYNMTIEYLPQWSKLFGRKTMANVINRLELIYFLVPIDLNETTYGGSYLAHIFCVSLYFKLFEISNDDKEK